MRKLSGVMLRVSLESWIVDSLKHSVIPIIT